MTIDPIQGQGQDQVTEVRKLRKYPIPNSISLRKVYMQSKDMVILKDFLIFVLVWHHVTFRLLPSWKW